MQCNPFLGVPSLDGLKSFVGCVGGATGNSPSLSYYHKHKLCYNLDKSCCTYRLSTGTYCNVRHILWHNFGYVLWCLPRYNLHIKNENWILNIKTVSKTDVDHTIYHCNRELARWSTSVAYDHFAFRDLHCRDMIDQHFSRLVPIPHSTLSF